MSNVVHLKLQKTAAKCNNVLCVGLDFRINWQHRNYTAIENMSNSAISLIEALNYEHLCYTFKFNYAFFSQLGFDGLKLMKTLIDTFKNENFIILDFKKSDIGSTMDAYLKEAEFFSPDAVTLVPFFGVESLQPFISQKNMLNYVVVAPSNKEGKTITSSVITLNNHQTTLTDYFVDNLKSYPNVGFVVPFERSYLEKYKNHILLMPGLGAQGYGSSIESSLFTSHHRVNVSRGILYPESGTIIEAAKKYADYLKINPGFR